MSKKLNKWLHTQTFAEQKSTVQRARLQRRRIPKSTKRLVSATKKAIAQSFGLPHERTVTHSNNQKPPPPGKKYRRTVSATIRTKELKGDWTRRKVAQAARQGLRDPKTRKNIKRIIRAYAGRK